MEWIKALVNFALIGALVYAIFMIVRRAGQLFSKDLDRFSRRKR